MRVRRGFLNWGVFLVCLGAVLLAVQTGVVDRDTVASLLRLWPLILVGIGLGLLLRFSRAEALGGLVVAGTLGLLFGVLFAGGLPTSVVCPEQTAAGSPITQTGTFASSATLDFEFSCADVSINRLSPDTTPRAWNVSVIAGANKAPAISALNDSLHLRSDTTSLAPFSGQLREKWLVTLPAGLPLSVNGTFNAAKSTLQLGGLLNSVNLTYNASDNLVDLSSTTATGSLSFNATYNASSGKLQLPDAPLIGHMTLNASTLNVCLPVTPAVRIQFHGTLSSDNLAALGFIQEGGGDTWSMPAFESTELTRVDLEISANVSTLTINHYGECQ